MPQELSDGTWVNRACDRCRRRKARCDGTRRCENCINADVACTHSAPILKRGPRRTALRSNRVEDRLRSLEELISSIAGGAGHSNPVAPDTLSAGEVQRIRDAAQTSESPTDIPEFSWINYSPSPALQTVPGTNDRSLDRGPSPIDESVDPNNLARDLNQGLMHMDQHGVAGPSSWTMASTSLFPFSSWEISTHAQQPEDTYPRYEPPAPSGAAFVRSRETPLTPDRDLLYRDGDGQTRFLGPSSGMPMLDSLKPPLSATSGPGLDVSQNESWSSLSASIGLDFDRPRTSRNPRRDSGLEATPKSRKSLWDQLTAVCPVELIDRLVRSYFTISHLLWPILHVPTFMETWENRNSRNDPSFVTLLSSIISLSSRYTDAPGLTLAMKDDIRLLASRAVMSGIASSKENLYLVQALFNMSVVQEGTANPSLLWTYLSPAISMAIDLGLHRRSDEWASFNAIDVELRKRLMWALYSQNIKVSSTYGRPPLLRLVDLGIDEPVAADDINIKPEGITSGHHADQHSVMAGFVIAVRLHMILERIITRINGPKHATGTQSSFIGSVLTTTAIPTHSETSDLDLLSRVTEGLGSPSDWLYDPKLLVEPDNLRFFQATRIFALQLFIRLLVARHEFTTMLAKETNGSALPAPVGLRPGDMQNSLHRVMRCALSIIGLYSTIDRHRRLHFFGAHAIVQVSQAGTALVGLILHLRSTSSPREQNIFHLALQGLPVAITVLRQLGRSRPAGHRAADVLVEFSRACAIPVFTEYAGLLRSADTPAAPGDAETHQGSLGQDPETHEAKIEVDVPMLRSLIRRSPAEASINEAADNFSLGAEAGFDAWLGIALQDAHLPQGGVVWPGGAGT